MFNNPAVQIATIVAIPTEVLRTSSGIAPETKSLPKVKILIITTKARVNSESCKSGKERLISLLLLNSRKAHKPTVILFDFGATHSFISDKCAARVGLESSQATAQYMITTPGGKIVSNQILRLVPIQMGSKLIKSNLISLILEGMDVILGMDWMTQHGVLLDISS